MAEKKEIQNSENAKLYELGFHIIPTVTEKEVASVFSKIKEIISKNNGSILKEGEPKVVKLAYTIVKKIGTKNEKFNNAFFAWVKFNAESADIEAIKKIVDADKSIIRYIVVKTVDDDKHSTIQLAEIEAEEEAEEPVKEEKVAKVEKTEENVKEEIDEAKETAEISGQPEKAKDVEAEASEDELDKVIDEIVEEK